MESLSIILAYSLDLTFGDPKWLPHPVKIMGDLINFLEAKLRTDCRKKISRIKGAILALVVVGISGLSAYLILTFMRKINPIAGTFAWIFLAYTSLATKGLFLHARKVVREVTAKNICAARKQLSRIAGRDTERLSEGEVVKATVESIAENTNDGIIAPLFYLMLGGPTLAIAYKAINTLDSMVGYKSKKYIHFGWFSAKLDDLVNFLPARITGLFIAASSFILKKNFKDSFKIMFRDGRKHPSPNSGICEAAMAGALGIKLGGPSTYQGKLSRKPYLGDMKRVTAISFINEALTISFVSSVLMVSMGVILKWLM
ncbi:MAG: adenosylcobinamide-phosphate synthase CbiB [Omnitrophica bacterium]|nr:adenosylcobinamide-phosphate synthase CbiB [Candidatus Omnitrophota bacterium]